MTSRSASVTLSLAKLLVLRQAPYYYGLVNGFRCVPREDFKFPMGVTEGLVLYYNPDMISELTFEEVAGVLVHEVHHVIRKHLQRTKQLPEHPMRGHIANIAGDLTINDDLLRAGWQLPKDGMFMRSFPFLRHGLSMEEYYRQLLQKEKEDKEGKGGKDAGAKDGTGSGKDEPCHCGGVAGNPEPFEAELDKQFSERTTAQRELLVRSTLEEIVKAGTMARHRGQLSAGLLAEIAESLSPPKVDWRRQLRYLLRTQCGMVAAGGEDFSRRVPNKSALSRGLSSPSLIGYTPEVCFVLDTSGSMDNERIRDVLNEAHHMLKTFNIQHAWLIHADSEVHHTERVVVSKLARKFTAHGRGGTDFAPGLRAADNLRPRPDLVVYLTDGEGVTAYKPRAKILWVVCGVAVGAPPLPYGPTVSIAT